MSGFDGALAIKLNFGDVPTAVTSTSGRGRAELRLAPRPTALSTDKYRTFEQRRRAAQIKARHVLDRLDLDDRVLQGPRSEKGR